MTRARFFALTAALAHTGPPSAPADPTEIYTVSPKATADTKAAIAAGRPPLHGYPVIVAVDWTTTQLHPGSTIEATVKTSINITWVEGRYKDWAFAFEQIGLGRFHVAYRIPFLPPFLLGKWKLDVIARSDDGVEVRRGFTFTYSYF
jgi:hypothetical protein